jgi:type IV pilus assembly protein PilE
MHPSAHSPRPARRIGGFTLIELMIAMAIVAILATVALPSFLDSLRKNRRAEAFSAMAAVQQAQERYRSNNAGYADTLALLGITSTTSTPKGYYTLQVVTAPATITTTYTVSAVAVSGTSQAKDGNCRQMAVRASGGQLSYAGCASCSFVPADFSETNACWAR